jgi:diadenosine tetraphosphate (Ap4A) HIT family hydrolase
MDNPFVINTDKPYVAVKGLRCGYVQLATSQVVTEYADMPDELLTVAKAWAIRLTNLGARRVYWVTLSEVVTHLHIHLYPRWDDELKGLALFEARNNSLQPNWSPLVLTALDDWAKTYGVAIK